MNDLLGQKCLLVGGFTIMSIDFLYCTVFWSNFWKQIKCMLGCSFFWPVPAIAITFVSKKLLWQKIFEENEEMFVLGRFFSRQFLTFLTSNFGQFFFSSLERYCCVQFNLKNISQGTNFCKIPMRLHFQHLPTYFKLALGGQKSSSQNFFLSNFLNRYYLWQFIGRMELLSYLCNNLSLFKEWGRLLSRSG